MNYRSKSFIEFVRKTKMPFYFGWMFNIWFVGYLILQFFTSYNDNMNDFWDESTIIIIMMLLGGKLFIYGVPYYIYKVGNHAFNDIKCESKEILKDVKIYIKGFDLFKQKKFFPPSLSKTLYSFNLTDLIISDESIILLGKDKSMGTTMYAYPVEITNSRGQTRLVKVKLNSWKEINGKVEIELNDPNYKNLFRIEFKEEIDKLKQWLTINNPY